MDPYVSSHESGLTQRTFHCSQLGPALRAAADWLETVGDPMAVLIEPDTEYGSWDVSAIADVGRPGVTTRSVSSDDLKVMSDPDLQGEGRFVTVEIRWDEKERHWDLREELATE